MSILRRQLVVLARWPAPGRCKQRLAASCGSSQAAAAVQRHLTAHTMRVATTLQGIGLTLAVAGIGPRARRRWGRPWREQAGGDRLRLSGQCGGNLACRMQAQFRESFRRGAEQVVLIGTDLPGLETEDLEQAFALLSQHPLVLGPARDGGYWLIGLTRAGYRSALPRLMSGIPWGSSQVLGLTLAQAAALNLNVGLLRTQSDLDNAADLAPWLQRRCSDDRAIPTLPA